MPSTFDDLLEANRAYAAENPILGFDGVAHAGVAVVTCMDSRIDPLRMIGLKPGDAKIFRNPGGRVTDQALEALVLATHLLGVNRVLVIPHTRCAMANSTEAELQRRVGESAGRDATWHRRGARRWVHLRRRHGPAHPGRLSARRRDDDRSRKPQAADPARRVG